MAALMAVIDLLESENEEKSKRIFITVPALLALLRDERNRIRSYFSNVVPQYFNHEFKRLFRLEPTTFENLLQLIGNVLANPVTDGHGRPPIKIEEQLLITLMWLGSQQTIRCIADRFDRTDSATFKTRNKICKILTNVILPRFIKWPSFEEYDAVAQDFQPFPGIIGCIDGTHIQIPAPSEDPGAYFNRKQVHSIILQAVCISNMLFTHVIAGWPGRVHDSRVLKNSDIWQNIGPTIPEQYHILGDGAYPIRGWLITPYRDNGHLNRTQRAFNRSFSSKRQAIERAFALLKGRFPRLKYCNTKKLKYTIRAIISSCVLHNVCILQDDNFEDLVQIPDDEGQNNVNDVTDNGAAGLAKRNEIAENL